MMLLYIRSYLDHPWYVELTLIFRSGEANEGEGQPREIVDGYSERHQGFEAVCLGESVCRQSDCNQRQGNFPDQKSRLSHSIHVLLLDLQSLYGLFSMLFLTK